MTQTVGVVIPAYRPDVALLGDYVRALQERLAPDVVRIELDAATPAVVESVSTLPVEVNAVAHRRGKGTAITAGFEALDTDVLVFADADGSTPADSIADVLEPVLSGRADLSVGSRRHPDATVASHQTFARRYLGDGFAWIARHLLDAKLYDYQCGAKAMTCETWRSVRRHLYEPGFAWDIELVAVAAALGARLAEVPVVWEDQPGSTVSPAYTTYRLGRGLLVARHRAKLLADDSLHELLESRRDGPPSLVDRLAAEALDE
ncbi:Glycosyl transferase family 2 [Halogranum rubrum]|uniref:Glycosyl transferase family 2 n=1 Tax=Halogranum rubrum TaxID=553466 RepID=A0A1I4EG02_9EURY|nr:glycosyltransferase [Halogranum rubrum]SFL03266.1 Glycosyl transferase family 2 [Halogranum rubrum]